MISTASLSSSTFGDPYNYYFYLITYIIYLKSTPFWYFSLCSRCSPYAHALVSLSREWIRIGFIFIIASWLLHEAAHLQAVRWRSIHARLSLNRSQWMLVIHRKFLINSISVPGWAVRPWHKNDVIFLYLDVQADIALFVINRDNRSKWRGMRSGIIEMEVTCSCIAIIWGATEVVRDAQTCLNTDLTTFL